MANPAVRPIQFTPPSLADLEAAKVLRLHATGGILIKGTAQISNALSQPGTRVTNAATLSGGNGTARTK